MRSFATLLPVAALLAATPILAQWLPSCSWNDCLGSWDGNNCNQASGWDCICGNSTAIAQINTCVATSCTNATDQEAIYGAIAQLCVNNGVTVTNAQQATFSATSGGSLYPTITGKPGWGPGGNYNSSAWASWVSAASTAVGSAPNGWGPGASWGAGWHGGPGGSRSGGVGPWGTKASGIDCAHWTTWTAGWGPFSSWTGTWSGCSSTTNSPLPATITTTVTTSGRTSVITGTTFGVQQVAAASTSGSGAASTHAHISDSRTMGLCGAVAVAVFSLMIAL